MAQISFITRGFKQDTEQFINNVQAQYTQFNNVKDGKIVGYNREQWGIRPIQLWEIFFRDTPDHQVMQCIYNNLQLGGHKYKGVKFSAAQRVLQTALQCKSIPKEIHAAYKDVTNDPTNPIWLMMKNMETIPIGYRPDEIKTEMI